MNSTFKQIVRDVVLGVTFAVALASSVVTGHLATRVRAPEPPPPTLPDFALQNYELTVNAGDEAQFQVIGKATDARFVSGSPDFHVVQLRDGSRAVGWSIKPGQYRVTAYGLVNGKLTDPETGTVTVVSPVPPVPPKPPTPPTPPSPIPSDGLRVLIIRPAPPAALSAAQTQAIDSAQLRAYLNSHCIKGVDGKTAEWRILTEAQDVTNESQLWKDFFKLPRKSAPWLYVANGDKGVSEPLPADLSSIMADIQKVGGQ